MNRVFIVLVLLLGGFLECAASDGKATVGSPMPDLHLRSILGGDGRERLSELRGQPVIIAWYSTVFAGLEAARVAVALEEKHAKDGLAVFLMEIKNHDATYLRALQMKELPGAGCPLMPTQELQVAYDEAKGLPPNMILIGVDGTLLYAGSYQSSNELKKLLKAELRKRATGWGEDPLAIKARALAYGKGKLGEAWTMLQEGADDASSPELKEVSAEIAARFDAWKRSVNFLVDQGRPLRALETAESLVKASSGHPEWESAARELCASFDTPEMKAELKLDKKLESLLKSLRSKRPKKGFDANLSRFAEKAKDSKIGGRATRLAAAVKRSQDKL